MQDGKNFPKVFLMAVLHCLISVVDSMGGMSIVCPNVIG